MLMGLHTQLVVWDPLPKVGIRIKSTPLGGDIPRVRRKAGGGARRAGGGVRISREKLRVRRKAVRAQTPVFLVFVRTQPDSGGFYAVKARTPHS